MDMEDTLIFGGHQGSTYSMYDAMTGDFVLNITGVTVSTLTEDQNGNLLDYYVNSSTANAYKAPTLNLWNASELHNGLGTSHKHRDIK